MSSLRTTAEGFFEACETGKGWGACREYCHEEATFSAQAEALAGVTTLQAYTDWMQGITTLMPGARYDLKFFGVDENRRSVGAYAVFHGTHTGEGGPVPPTGKSTASDYVYVMEFDGDKIRHVTKIWNAPFALKELGWA